MPLARDLTDEEYAEWVETILDTTCPLSLLLPAEEPPNEADA